MTRLIVMSEDILGSCARSWTYKATWSAQFLKYNGGSSAFIFSVREEFGTMDSSRSDAVYSPPISTESPRVLWDIQAMRYGGDDAGSLVAWGRWRT